MKSVTLSDGYRMEAIEFSEVCSDLRKLFAVPQGEKILVTHKGKPVVVIMGAQGYDEEDFLWASDAEFWQQIQESRRRNDGIPLEVVEAQLAARERAERTAKRRKPARRKATKLKKIGELRT